MRDISGFKKILIGFIVIFGMISVILFAKYTKKRETVDLSLPSVSNIYINEDVEDSVEGEDNDANSDPIDMNNVDSFSLDNKDTEEVTEEVIEESTTEEIKEKK